MITARITGGLGNQMFQYAVARALARAHRTSMRLDLGLYAASKAYIHRFELDQLAVDDYAVPTKLQSAALWAARQARIRLGETPALRKVYCEKAGDPPDFDAAVLALPDGCFLNGYFQSDRYFESVAAELRQAFRPRDPEVSRRVLGFVSGVRRSGRPLVSLHVRRSNYLTVRTDGSLVVPLEKTRAVMERFTNMDFMVFSDDISWCRANIAGEQVSYSPFASSVEDMTAMSHCDHHVIANSTFSWWAAWLNDKPGKIVLAPANWSRPGSEGSGGHPDLYPQGWMKY